MSLSHRSRVVAVVTAVALAVGGLWSVAGAAPAGADALDDEATLVRLLGDLRSQMGLAPVAEDARLVQVARAWSAQMAADNVLQHNPNLGAQAPAGDPLHENVGRTMGTAYDVEAGFVASPHHLPNMIDPAVTAVGIGVVNSGGWLWVTQVFLRPATAIEPYVSAASAGGAAGVGDGYRMVASDGTVSDFGWAAAQAAAPTLGAAAGAATPSGKGYWIASANGHVDARGDAPALGGMDGRALSAPIVGMAATPTGRGYWLLGRDGGIFSFGDAAFFGSTGAMRLNQPVVAMASTPSGLGYWFVAADGGIFAFGDAGFLGSTGAIHLNQPVVGMASTTSGNGYWLVARDGGIFAFGDAAFLGSAGDLRLARPIVGMVATADGAGYRFVASDGGVFTYGSAAFLGSLGGGRSTSPVVALLPA